MVLHGKAVAVGTDPQTVMAVDVQTLYAGNSGRGIQTFKCAAIIADQTAVTADPDETVRCLYDIVGFRSRKTVCVVVEDSRKTVALSDRINGYRTVVLACTGPEFISVFTDDWNSGFQQKNR